MKGTADSLKVDGARIVDPICCGKHTNATQTALDVEDTILIEGAIVNCRGTADT